MDRKGFHFYSPDPGLMSARVALSNEIRNRRRINLDPANLILYGKGNPIDALDVFGSYVRNIHAKDGVWPNRDETLGHETALGEGDVRFDLLIRRLKAKGFEGPLTIEREISGPQQVEDIKKAMALLEPML